MKAGSVMAGETIREVRVEVPASTANLGPGFDCLGLALSLYHRLTAVEIDGAGLEIRTSGQGAGVVPPDGDNAVYRAMAQAFAATGHQPGRLLLECRNDIPLARGLGSSAASLLAGLAAGLLLSGQEPGAARLIAMGAAAEGHPDNVVPAVLGGFTAAAAAGGRVDYVRIEPPAELRVVVAIPDFTLSTRKAREALPRQIPFRDAVANLGRVGLLTAAMASHRMDLLRTAMEDSLHQPYREKLVPGFQAVRRAALEAGALGAALSGAGPAMMALAEGDGEGIGRAMQAAWEAEGIAARSRVLEVDRLGLRGSVVRGGGAR
jgi:homoserine kinase